METFSKNILALFSTVFFVSVGDASSQTLVTPSLTVSVPTISSSVLSFGGMSQPEQASPIAIADGLRPTETLNGFKSAVCPIAASQNELAMLTLSNSTANIIHVEIQVTEITLESAKLVSTERVNVPAAADGKPGVSILELSALSSGRPGSVVIIPIDGSEAPTSSLTRVSTNAQGEIQVGTPLFCVSLADLGSVGFGVVSNAIPAVQLIPGMK